ncbi:MAG TPA: hypothetical protein VK569_05670, partial [Bacteroidota bacterium]|nr:hypothetical protein [Bacteroidota bacterium]
MQINIPGYAFKDLFEPLRLAELTEVFAAQLRMSDPDLHRRYADYVAGRVPGSVALSALLTDLAPHVGGFLAR